LGFGYAVPSRLARMVWAPRTHLAETLDRRVARIAIVSPHLDDAVLSLGAAMRAAARDSGRVAVITVFAGDPTSLTPADLSSRQMGFPTAGVAARTRIAEDAHACQMLGVDPVWLPFPDDANERQPSDEEITQTLRRRLSAFDRVLLPGFPLTHPDHVRVSRLALSAVGPAVSIGLYVEQPYAAWNSMSREFPTASGLSRDRALAELGIAIRAERWSRCMARPDDWAAKWRAMGQYRSQLRVLRRGPRLRSLGYAAVHGGEEVLWLESKRSWAREGRADADIGEKPSPETWRDRQLIV
jgi:LmbE family N-acetylglucosaminyl deacetylase